MKKIAKVYSFIPCIILIDFDNQCLSLFLSKVVNFSYKFADIGTQQWNGSSRSFSMI